MKKFYQGVLLYACAIVSSIALISATVWADTSFSDVPAGHWAHSDIMTLKKLDVTQGLGNNEFGMGRTITRAEFVTFLTKLFGWSTRATKDNESWYSIFVESATSAGAVTASEADNFRPNSPITREEMAIMLVRSMGYDSLARELNTLPTPFADVSSNIGYITIAKDFGVISGMTADTFEPSATATREQGASMMVRLYNKLSSIENTEIEPLNLFYAIKSADQQKLISMGDSVCFGWSRVEWSQGVSLNQTSGNKNEYARPSGATALLDSVRAQGKRALLMVTVENKYVSNGNKGDVVLVEYLLSSESLRRQLVNQIAAAAADFDGVAIDFENLKGEQSRVSFLSFLSELKSTLAQKSKFIAVAVQPARYRQEYYDGYDFKAIGKVANQIILMAHDYNSKRLTDSEMESGFNITPLSPINEVYYALKAITDPNFGVEDHSKILLQISFSSAQWKTTNGSITNKTPFQPSYDAIKERITKGAKQEYSEKYEAPYITFFNEEDNSDNIVWYENNKSVQAKITLARLLGIKGVSVWRLGIIPSESISIFQK
ncbi:MAG: S-layer homology domain-containing protein [Clostridiales bacterium]|jgi:spore germination protein YaaH|nr:S-layer homology domain-containing protein [Clostridiales bacterium]